MTPWILAVLALFVVQTFLPAAIRYANHSDRADGLKMALGGRDVQPNMPVVGERAARALANLHEAMFVFVPVALLLEMGGDVGSWATNGALVFLIARVLYVPAYLSAVLGVRSTMWTISWVGLGMMIAELVTR